MQTVVQVTLDRQGFVQELFVHLFLGGLAKQDALGVVILVGSVCLPDHLHDVRDRVVVVGVQLAVVVLGVHDDHEVAADAERPAQGPGYHDHLNGSRVKQRFDDLPVGAAQSFVEVGDSLADRLIERLVPELLDEGLDVFEVGVEEPVRVVVGRGVGEEVDGRQPRLLARRDEDSHQFARAMVRDGVEDRGRDGLGGGGLLEEVELVVEDNLGAAVVAADSLRRYNS